MNANEQSTTEHTEEAQPKKTKRKFFERRSGWILTGIFVVFVILILAGVSGAARGINDRVSLAESQAASRIQTQLDSARSDIEEGRYQVALDRLDWILEEMTDFLNDENLTEIGELYSQTLLMISSIGTPTPRPSPTPIEPVVTPTPDLRPVEELFETALAMVGEGAWDEAIRTIAALRENNLTYRAVEVDGMLYIALRNRGLHKILVEGSLEPGIYDLSLAERFAPLDSRAEGLRTWTRLYLTGASFWEVDWSQVVFYFEQVYPHLPNLRDGTFMTATDRYRIGAVEYAQELMTAGEFCEAQAYFEKAQSISPDPEVQPLAQDAAEACLRGEQPSQGEEQVPPAETPTPTVEPTNGAPEEPGGEPTAEPTVEPTQNSGG
jgi:tetratricopeptide (TPR) repeat protein